MYFAQGTEYNFPRVRKIRAIRVLACEVVGLGILIAWVMWKFPELVDDIVPWFALAIAWHFTWEFILDTKTTKRLAIALGRRVNKMVIWLIVFVIGGAVSVLYWVGINKAIGKLAAIASVRVHAHAPADVPKQQPTTQGHDISASAPIEKPVPPAKPRVHPKNPLDIVAFDSNHELMLHNHSDDRIFVIDMKIEGVDQTTTIGLQATEIPPRDVKAIPCPGVNGRSMEKLAPSWKEHVHLATQTYPGCVGLAYFTPNDGAFLMMKEHYIKQGTEIAAGDATGTIHYRIGDGTETKSQTFPLVVTTFIAISQQGCEGK